MGPHSYLVVWLSHIKKLLCQYQSVAGHGDVLELGTGCFISGSLMHLNLTTQTQPYPFPSDGNNGHVYECLRAKLKGTHFSFKHRHFPSQTRSPSQVKV